MPESIRKIISINRLLRPQCRVQQLIFANLKLNNSFREPNKLILLPNTKFPDTLATA